MSPELGEWEFIDLCLKRKGSFIIVSSEPREEDHPGHQGRMGSWESHSLDKACGNTMLRWERSQQVERRAQYVLRQGRYEGPKKFSTQK